MADNAQDIVAIWREVVAPEPPELSSVELDPSSSALLVLDIQHQNCSARPRCLASLTKVRSLLDRARASGMVVVYTLAKVGKREDVLEEVSPRDDEPSVASGVDKFFNTNLEDILVERGVETVVLVGTAAHGAILHTGTGAALRGSKIVVPVDCMSALETYAEQYTAWHLTNAPGTKTNTQLTRSDMINIG